MNKYKHDSERWLRSQASIYRACHNRELTEKFTLCVDEVEALKAENAKLKYSNDGFANFYHDLELKHRAMTAELAALKEAARPVAEWLKYAEITELSAPYVEEDGEKRLEVFATTEELEALAALVGEE